MEPQELEAIIQRVVERRKGIADNSLDRYREYAADPKLQLGRWPYRRLAELVLDTAATFNGGVKQTVRWVQEAINAHGAVQIAVDGHAGPQTWAAMVLVDERWLIGYVVAERVQRHAAMVSERPNALPRLVDWMTRATVWLQQGGALKVPAPAKPAPEPDEPPASDEVVLVRMRDSTPVYWTGSVAWAGRSQHEPDTDDRRDKARKMTRDEHQRLLALWPILSIFQEVPA